MRLSKTTTIYLLFIAVFCIPAPALHAQQVTGVWKGKIDRKSVEVKIIQKGDSLTGTSYYYESRNNYRRYSIKGYFEPSTNSVVWWDDELLEGSSSKDAVLSVADFNCPGGGRMLLDGNTAPKDNPDEEKGKVHLVKEQGPSFHDEWDYVIDNYTVGGNDPYIIDSIGLIAKRKTTEPPVAIVAKAEPPILAPKPQKDMVYIPPPPPKNEQPKVERPISIQEKFTTRKQVFTKEIPISGDSVELRFYDNAQVDGDSISLFLNNKLIFEHIRLTDKAYSIKLATGELFSTNDLVMVAENLGSIPPNTSYMVAIVGDKRYEAQLASTENSSAMIRLRKE